ncbi:TPA: molecular chaperone [Morganella morganii]|uniref:fimbrial biogenesis chaperone n=1 Tax=Morganella morganii TaxID=582 RepID=UPI00091B84FB|nr:molecular chaperone [Morganella morganii]SHM18344.1 P pilus assembly protein, chaperone PapD [Morganella morganii]
MIKSIKIVILIFSCIFINNSFADISLGSTRIVISDGKNEGSVSAHNRDKINYLIQSWVLDENDKETDKFAITPPLFKLESNTSSSLRVVMVGDLPEDRESLYWLNVKFIPSTDKDINTNKLTFAVNNRIKVIYRPKSLSFSEPVEVFKRVSVRYIDGNIEFKNPTKYFINISEVKVNDVILKSPSYIEPESSVLVSVGNKKKPSRVGYTLIDDLGKLNLFQAEL